MIVIDTNALARFFIKDVVFQATKVKKLLEAEHEVLVPETVFIELEYVLIKIYKISREKVIEMFKFLVSNDHLIVDNEIKKAVRFYEIYQKLSLSDCLVIVYGQNLKLATFDKEILKVAGVQPYWG